ncbi:hypothetical protein [Streptosporangium sp. NPDC000396]|uniref:hypothetical protein n=1 Tax=Streptosporangium sp. NPDC000396 TaxID=3366185 RepID=UPI0036B66570
MQRRRPRLPPEDSGGPEGYVEHMRAFRHRKGWKYRVAKHIFGTTRWDPAQWDRAEVNVGLAGLAKLWAKQAAAKAKREAKEKAAAVVAEASAEPSVPENSRPGNGRFRDDETIMVAEERPSRNRSRNRSRNPAPGNGVSGPFSRR